MSDPATYQAYSFRPVKATNVGSQRAVVGKIRWRIAPELDLDDYLEEWENKGYKTGLNILDDQSIVTFSYDDEFGGQIVMQASPSDIPDLENTLGKQTGYKWVAYTSPLSSAPRKYTKVPDQDHSVEFTVNLTLSNPRLYRELIGAASRHPGGSFTAGSMNSLWVVPVAPFTAP